MKSKWRQCVGESVNAFESGVTHCVPTMHMKKVWFQLINTANAIHFQMHFGPKLVDL